MTVISDRNPHNSAISGSSYLHFAASDFRKVIFFLDSLQVLNRTISLPRSCIVSTTAFCFSYFLSLNKIYFPLYRNRPVSYIHGNWTKYVYVLDEKANESYLASMASGEASNKKKKKKVPTYNTYT